MAVQDWTRQPFPAGRDRKAAGGAGPNALELTPPRAAVFSPFMTSNGGNTLVTVVSRRFTGPAIIRALRHQSNVADSATHGTGIALLISNEGGGQGSIPFASPLPAGVNIIQGATFVGAVPTYNTVHGDLLWLSALTTAPIIDLPIGYVTMLPEFYLKYVLATPGAASFNCFGAVTLLEAVDEQIIPDVL